MRPPGTKKRFAEEQIIGFPKQAEAGAAIKDLCRKRGCNGPPKPAQVRPLTRMPRRVFSSSAPDAGADGY